MPKKRTRSLTAKDLKPGLRFKYRGADVEILRDRVSDRDRFGLELDRWWSRNLGTGQEGYVSLGPGGMLGPVELLAKKRSKTVVSAKRPIGWTVTDPARPGWSETGTSTFDEDGRVHVQKRGEHHAKKKSPARLQRDIDEVLSRAPAKSPAFGAPRAPRLSVRPTTYRDVPGYGITGRDGFGRQISIFTRTREGADAIKRVYKERRDPDEIQAKVGAILLRGG